MEALQKAQASHGQIVTTSRLWLEQTTRLRPNPWPGLRGCLQTAPESTPRPTVRRVLPLLLLLVLCLAATLACSGPQKDLPVQANGVAQNAGDRQQDEHGFTAPTPATLDVLNRAEAAIPAAEEETANAARGFIAQPEALLLTGEDGQVLWDMPAYSFLKDASLAAENSRSIHPSLLRQARLNNHHGLFEVSPGIYQLRGFDLSNMTLIEGESGWIVVDPLTARQTAKAALSFAWQHLPHRPISAILYTHSHADHFGGVLGLFDADPQAQAELGTDPSVESSLPIFAPQGFLEEALSENVAAGTAMGRRASYMFGRPLPRTARGHIDSGLGKAPAFGQIGVLPPTRIIERTGEERVIDGVRFVFQLTPNSEAPAELTFYLPQKKAFCGAELVSHTLHNLYTLRGAKVRDALAWSGYIEQARQLFPEAEVIFNSHHWPVWGQQEVSEFLRDQRDAYKFIHDQTVGALNSGQTPREIAETLELPPKLSQRLANRGYYGTVSHNAKAVYQFYLGWFDGNPAHLQPLPPEQASRRYVQAMGGAAAVLRLGQQAFADGDYRWSAELLNRLVFSDASNEDAKHLLANTYDQLGYQAESAPWRDVYLTGAHELRHGIAPSPSILELSRDLLVHMPLSNLFTSLATRLDAKAAEGKHLRVSFHFTDLNERYLLEVHNSVLHHRLLTGAVDSDVTVSVTHKQYLQLVAGQVGLVKALAGPNMSLSGSRLKLIEFFRLLETPEGDFAIVTP